MYAGWLKAISSSLELLTFLQCFSLCSSDLIISIVLSSSLSNLLPAQICLWISLVKLFQRLFCFRLLNLENWKGFIFNYACTLVLLYGYVYVSAGPVKALRHGATGRCKWDPGTQPGSSPNCALRGEPLPVPCSEFQVFPLWLFPTSSDKGFLTLTLSFSSCACL